MDVPYIFFDSDPDVEFDNYSDFEKQFNKDFSKYMSGKKFKIQSKQSELNGKITEYNSGSEFLNDIVGDFIEPEEYDVSISVREFFDGSCTVFVNRKGQNVDFRLIEL